MNKKLLSLLFCLSLFISDFGIAKSIDTRVVVFDFGGVIADIEGSQMINFLLRSFKINRYELDKTFSKLDHHIVQGKSERQFWQQFASSESISLPYRWFDEFVEIITGSIIEIPETIALVRALKREGYQTAMLSNIRSSQAGVIRKLGYYDLFSPVLLFCEIGVDKPDPKAFQILLQTLKQPSRSVIFIDDKIDNIKAARKLGIDSILFINPKQLKNELKKRGFNLTMYANK